MPAALLDYGQGIEIITYREIRDILYRDLNKTTRAFEIYLSDYVEKISIDKISLEIKGLGVDHVLSFNYSHTYQRFYDKSQKARYDYIHGKAKHDNSIETNNMVLGIDEYLRGKSKNQEIDFIAFKKFYQRIYKATGCEYKNWVDEIVSSRYANEVALREQYPEQIPYLKFNAKHKVFIFGHSLDITDKDVLKDLILNDNVQTTIFYHKSYDKQGKHDNGRKDLGLKIANLVKVIGQDELIRRTGGSTKTIKFKLQTDMK